MLKLSVLLIVGLLTQPLSASTSHLDGTSLTLWWILPFVSVLLSLALLPLLLPKIWHHHYGKITGGIGLSTFIAMCIRCSTATAWYNLLTTIFHHYIPFIILIGTLYTISGHIIIRIHARPTPFANSMVLGLGSLLANVIGTTGAAILLIRPLLQLNASRQYKTHTVIFFIFTVCNVGGCLTPLGDPPLFLGFLNGVSFFWVTQHLYWPFVIIIGSLLFVYTVTDIILYQREPQKKIDPPSLKALPVRPPLVSLKGLNQLYLIGCLLTVIVLTAKWQSREIISMAGIALRIQDVVRDGCTIVIYFLSHKLGSQKIRHLNQFSWEPLLEIARLFAAIFVTAIPVIAILQAGHSGALKHMVTVLNPDGKFNDVAYFWFCGLLSAFLDNAPTYLIFFNSAGGKAQQLMTYHPLTLTAISMGAVFMGALSYIGNAPNFMVKSIAEVQGIKMPTFFGYMLWSCGILLPLLGLLSWIMFP